MKKLLILILLYANVAIGQNLGFSGTGFFENYDADVEQYLLDMHQPFVLRVPGGAISKFHDPANVKKGWGMTEKSVKDWFEKTGFDEDGNGLEKWLRKTSEQPDHSYMDDLIALQKKFPDMQVLYVLNVLNSTPEANMQAIRYMMKNGVRIVGVEAGNEVYGRYASFDEYVNDFSPIFKMLDKEYPDIKKGLVAGANTTRKDIVQWNEALAAYKGDYDAVILHYYYTQRELGEAYDMIPLRSAYDPNKENKELEKAYDKAAELLLSKQLLKDGIAYARDQFGAKPIWITEWNTKPSEMLSNTVLNAAWQFREMVMYNEQLEFFLIHNGVSPDKYGLISKANKVDSDNHDMIRRTGYWAYILASEAQGGKPLNKTGAQNLQVDADGEICLYFTNMDEAYNLALDLSKLNGATVTINYVSGKHKYSAGGFAGYMGKNSVPSYEINGIKRETYNGTIPKNSFGYILIKTKK